MKQLFKLLLVSLAGLVLLGCAHPITMNPDWAGIQAKNIVKIDRQVAYYISDANRALEVTTSGGGGDMVRYFPYRDIEPGFYKALSDVFRGVTKVQNPKDLEALRKSGISLLITPEVSTSSSSSSLVTWPPTQFTVTLSCVVTDAAGQTVHKLVVTGSGNAEFAEFAGNHSLAAVRASTDALSKLLKALGETPELRR